MAQRVGDVAIAESPRRHDMGEARDWRPRPEVSVGDVEPVAVGFDADRVPGCGPRFVLHAAPSGGWPVRVRAMADRARRGCGRVPLVGRRRDPVGSEGSGSVDESLVVDVSFESGLGVERLAADGTGELVVGVCVSHESE